MSSSSNLAFKLPKQISPMVQSYLVVDALLKAAIIQMSADLNWSAR